jgi:hypothetical protein
VRYARIIATLKFNSSSYKRTARTFNQNTFTKEIIKKGLSPQGWSRLPKYLLHSEGAVKMLLS